LSGHDPPPAILHQMTEESALAEETAPELSLAEGDRLSLGVAARLSRYLQVLIQARKMGKETISSQELAEYTHINSTQIRRDLSGFGKFGKRGVGYRVDSLVEQIRKILRSVGQHNIVLFGAGNLGQGIVMGRGRTDDADAGHLDLARTWELFEASTDFTIGLEEEFAIVDPDTLELRHRFEDMYAACLQDELLADSAAGELISSEIE